MTDEEMSAQSHEKGAEAAYRAAKTVAEEESLRVEGAASWREREVQSRWVERMHDAAKAAAREAIQPYGYEGISLQLRANGAREAAINRIRDELAAMMPSESDEELD